MWRQFMGRSQQSCAVTLHRSGPLTWCSSRKLTTFPALEREIKQVAESAEFRDWSERMSGLLAETPKREIYHVVD